MTGEDFYVARMSLHSIEQLDEILDHAAAVAETNSSIVKAPLIARRLPPLTAGADGT